MIHIIFLWGLLEVAIAIINSLYTILLRLKIPQRGTQFLIVTEQLHFYFAFCVRGVDRRQKIAPSNISSNNDLRLRFFAITRSTDDGSTLPQVMKGAGPHQEPDVFFGSLASGPLPKSVKYTPSQLITFIRLEPVAAADHERPLNP